MTEQFGATMAGNLDGLKVVEIADEQAEYCGLLLAGLGADVVKVEPPGGSRSRKIGPFYDKNNAESLFFWQYNRGKKSVVLNLPIEKSELHEILAHADVLLESTPRKFLPSMGLSAVDVGLKYPHLVHARLSPFGDTGPWADFTGSDIVHLALGGVMMNCGYDPEPNGHYDQPPIAPAMWHAYHIAGEQLLMGILAALLHRQRTGHGQFLSLAVHEAVSKCTEIDLMSWVMRRVPVFRQTCRHAAERVSVEQAIASSKDGRWTITRGSARSGESDSLAKFLVSFGAISHADEAQLLGSGEAAAGSRAIPGTTAPTERSARTSELMQRIVKKFSHNQVPWRAAQDMGLLWAPLRKPHENMSDEHWKARGTFAEVFHPSINRHVTYAVSRWVSDSAPWKAGSCAPSVGQHNEEFAADNDEMEKYHAPRDIRVTGESCLSETTSAAGKPFPLQNVRILDFTWFLASAGATRFLAGFGAETIKVEWKGNPDTRFGAMAPQGGREARRIATRPLEPVTGLNMGGQFHHKNAGKKGISLNLRDPRGLEIAKMLVAKCDVVAEGFSPGVMERWGLGYDVLKDINPNIIYCQQSGMGTAGTYGSVRTVGPVAAAFAGISEMSGLPEPFMPAGWGYSYLDWIGAYSFASAILAALFRRNATGLGQHIDASQTEAGIFINGTAIVDWSVNGQEWLRYGNDSPYVPAAPHGTFACTGRDRWVVIACFSEKQWDALISVMDNPRWARSSRFASIESRVFHKDEIHAHVERWTSRRDCYDVMELLQASGVPSGVCQTAEDRCDHDPQLRHLNWMTEIRGTEIGTWPIPEVPVRLKDTPAHVGGVTRRGAPCYGEDTDDVLQDLLGFTESDVGRLRREGVI